MSSKFARVPNFAVLIAAGMALLLVALRDGMASSQLAIPLVVTSCVLDAVLGAALLFVALFGSRFAAATAVIVGTLLLFQVALGVVMWTAFPWLHPAWGRSGFDLVIAASLVGPLLFPWSGAANKAVASCMAVTFGAMTLLAGTLVLLARA